MPKKDFFPALILTAVAVLALNSAILKYPLQGWHEPRAVLVHALIVLILFMGLTLRVGTAAAFVGGLLFGIYPGHALVWTRGSWHFWDFLLYAALLMASVAIAFAFQRFTNFLYTQEKIVRYLLMVCLGALIGWMAVETMRINTPWQDVVSLYRWRALHVHTARDLNALAQLLRRQPEYLKAQQYEHSRWRILAQQKDETAPALAQPDPAMTALTDEITALYRESLAVDKGRVETYHEMAGFFRDIGRTKDAKDVYKQVLTIDPKQRETYFLLGQMYEEERSPTLVIEMYNELLKLYPDDETVAASIIDAYSRALARHPEATIYQEKREEVLGAYEQLSKRKKYTANDYWNLGFLYEQVGGFEEAVRYYRKALELQPNHQKALYNLAYSYQASGDVKTALELYDRLLHFYPKFAGAYLNMGVIYNTMGDSAKAEYMYQKVIRLEPNNAQAYLYLGYLNESTGELREALNDYEKAVEYNPQYSEAYYNMGNVYAALHQYPEAVASYLKTIAIDPNHQNAFVNLSILEFKSGDYPSAKQYLEEARLLGYNPPESYVKALEGYKGK